MEHAEQAKTKFKCILVRQELYVLKENTILGL
jgi:hypothetical protein